MYIEDPPKRGYKPYREISAGKENDRKTNRQGLQIDEQDNNTGEYTTSKPGGEQCWQYMTAKAGERHDIGTWSQIVPAIIKTDGTIVPILDKTLAIDSDFDSLTQGSYADDDHTKVRLAEETSDGVPGIIIACLNHEKEEKIFFSLNGEKIKVDHKSVGNESTQIYDIKADGTIDIANVGTTKDFLWVESNEVNIKTEAKFNDGATKKGPINFETSSYPAMVVPSSPANYETKIVFDTGTQKWRGYTIAEASSVSIYYARIRWNYTDATDLSEGELMNYVSGVGFSVTGTKIWIDIELSLQVQFWTAGDDTIFIVRKIKNDLDRGGDVRHLYYAFFCFQDRGSEITHLQTETKLTTEKKLEGKLLSANLDPAPWDNPALAEIKTTIATIALVNQVVGRIPDEWITNTIKNWSFVEMSNFSRGQELWFRPIRPILDDKTNSYYRSAQEFVGTGTIAEYERV